MTARLATIALLGLGLYLVVVLVERRHGDVALTETGLELARADFYAKELSFQVSCSYGPGRYDARYEEEGLDYPVSQVRWTENRNMAAYFDLLASGDVVLDNFLDSRFPVDEAPAAIHSSSSLISFAANGRFPWGGMASSSEGESVTRRKSSLPFVFPALIAGPCFPPRMSAS